jgi:hypothetical protein
MMACGQNQKWLLRDLQSGEINHFVMSGLTKLGGEISLEEVQQSISDFINLSHQNQYTYSVDVVLEMLRKQIEDIKDYIAWHVRYKCIYEYQQLKLTCILLAASVTLSVCAYYIHKKEHQEFFDFKKELEDDGVSIYTYVTSDGNFQVTKTHLSKWIKASDHSEKISLQWALENDCAKYSRLYNRPSFISAPLCALAFMTSLLFVDNAKNRLVRLDLNRLNQKLVCYQDLLQFVIELQKTV